MSGALPYLYERRKFIVIAPRARERARSAQCFFRRRRMAAQFRDGSNESRLWKLIVAMKNKSANATRRSGDICGIIAREIEQRYALDSLIAK